MSFQNFDQFGGGPTPDGGAMQGAQNPQEGGMPGQMPEQGQTPFQGTPAGDGGPGSQGGAPGGDQKTTLW